MEDGSLVILSGGQNTRMGQNKAFLRVRDVPIIEKIIGELGTVFKEIIIVTNDPHAYKGLQNIRIVTDIYPGKGPLSGIHAGLTHASLDRSLIVACDMPFVARKTAQRLFRQSRGWDVTVPVIEGKYQPLFAIYAKSCLKPIEQQLQAGIYKITSFYSQVRVREIDYSELNNGIVPEKFFYNVNTPAELEEARKMATEIGGEDNIREDNIHEENTQEDNSQENNSLEDNQENNTPEDKIQEDNAQRRSARQDKKYVQAYRWKAGMVELIDDPLAAESPLTVFLNDQEIVTLLCSPVNQDELAVGFLVSEGLIKGDAGEIRVRVDCEQGMAWVTADKVSIIAEQTFLKRYITTGCGKGTTFYNVMDAKCRPVTGQITVAAEKIIELMTRTQQVSRLFKDTGGVHLAALCSVDRMILYREDIGRHNALDKIVGRCYMDNISVDDKILFTTGRLSSEILLKVAKLGAPILVSRSAPTELAVKLARQLGVTLIGFARGGRFNLYANEYRVLGG